MDPKWSYQKENNTRDSNVVPHRSTNRARACLTSLSGREAVLSCWYGRSRDSLSHAYIQSAYTYHHHSAHHFVLNRHHHAMHHFFPNFNILLPLTTIHTSYPPYRLVTGTGRLFPKSTIYPISALIASLVLSSVVY